MFESLTERLNGVFKQLRRRGKLSEADVDTAMREVRLALLEADVHHADMVVAAGWNGMQSHQIPQAPRTTDDQLVPAGLHGQPGRAGLPK